MSTIQIRNPQPSTGIKTFVSQDYTSGTTLYVDSSVAFKNGNYILVGEFGLEKSEVIALSAAIPSNTSLTIGALKFSHTKGTPVYYINWDKCEIDYNDGTGWATYGSMPISLTYDNKNTEYNDSAATTSYEWRYRYYSTENSVYSDYSPTITAAGWPKNSVGYMVREVRKIANDPEAKTISDTEIVRFFNAAQDKIYSLYDRWWFLLKMGSAIDTVASQKVYNLPSDFGRMGQLLFNYVSGSTDINYNLKYLPMVEFDYESSDNNASDDDNMKYFTIYPGDTTNETGYVYIWPTPETAGLHLTPRYYKTFTTLESYSDETECPIPAILVDYALAQVFKIRMEDTRADYYDKLFREQMELLRMLQRKQVGSPRYMWKYQGPDAESRYFGSRGTGHNEENDW
jgi:hypothetical protein